MWSAKIYKLLITSVRLDNRGLAGNLSILEIMLFNTVVIS